MTLPDDQLLPEMPDAGAIKEDQRELLRFLREEAEASRKAQREESDANRKLFLDTSKIVAIPLAVLLTLAGIFFYHDVNSMKEAMKAQGEASGRVEIEKINKNIDDTLQAQFKTEAIKSTIQQAAIIATREQAPALIKDVITPEVKRAVASQSGAIKDVATRAATDEVKSAIDPVVADVKLQSLIARANADDSKALDDLLQLRNTGSPSQRDLVNGTIVTLQRRAAEEKSVDRLPYYFECANPGGADYQARLTSTHVDIRRNAIADCIAYMGMGQWVPKVPGESVSAFKVIETVAPMWTKLALSDPSISVRAEAIRGLNWLLRGQPGLSEFNLLDTTSLRAWWEKNASNQGIQALLAFAYGGLSMEHAERLDEIGLYEEVQRLAKTSPQPLAAELVKFQQLMGKMIATRKLSQAELANQMGRDCAGVQQDLGIRLKTFLDRPEQERVDNFALLEMQYLESACTVQDHLLLQIAEYGISTRSLSRRYEAVEIVNRTRGESLDPYDSRPLEDWLKAHHDTPTR